MTRSTVCPVVAAIRGHLAVGGVYREACLDYLPEAKVGDYTVIHVGFAIRSDLIRVTFFFRASR